MAWGRCWPNSITSYGVTRPQSFNSLRPRQNGRRFADDSFKCIFLNENVLIFIKILLNFIPKGTINNIPALIQIMAWRIYASLGLNELKNMTKYDKYVNHTRKEQWNPLRITTCWRKYEKSCLTQTALDYGGVIWHSQTTHMQPVFILPRLDIWGFSMCIITLKLRQTLWRHIMETFPRYWPFVRGIHRSPVNSPHKGQWRGALVFSLICALNKRLSKQSWGWWFETPSRSLWRHCK